MPIQLPDGVRFTPEGWTWSRSGATITFAASGGGSFTYVAADNNAQNAEFVLQQIDVYLADKRNSVTAIPAYGPVISSISPTSFDITTAALTVLGTGFNPPGAAQSSGSLIARVPYVITTYAAGDDFTNLSAASNASGVGFISNNTTPTNWSHGSILTPTPFIVFEDVASGQDSNGYFHVGTFVSSEKLTTVYGGTGDSGLSTGMIIYYLDPSGATSKSIAATNPSGTLITIP